VKEDGSALKKFRNSNVAELAECGITPIKNLNFDRW
jgi:hypothetical protein